MLNRKFLLSNAKDKNRGNMNKVYSSIGGGSYVKYNGVMSRVEGTPYAITIHYSESGTQYYSLGGVIPGNPPATMIYMGRPVSVRVFVENVPYDYSTYDSAVAGAVAALAVMAVDQGKPFEDMYNSNKRVFDEMIKLEGEFTDCIEVIIQSNILNIEYKYADISKNIYMNYDITNEVTIGNGIGFVRLLNPKIDEE